MASIKTTVNDANVDDFLNSVDNEQRRQDAFTLLKLFSDITGEPPKMWGDSIIGFGSYHYKSDRSQQEGDWMLTAFSPRKQNLTIYIMPGFDGYSELLAKLGKYKTSVSCLYINKLADINIEVLTQLVERSYKDMKAQYIQEASN